MNELNCVGDICPLPVIKAKKALESLSEGCLAVIVDNEIAAENLEKLAKEKGLIYELVKDSSKLYRVIFHKNSEKSVEDVNKSLKPDAHKKKDKGQHLSNIVVISSDKMGDGDDKLGRALIKGFIYALSESNSVPEAVIFYNKGAHLSAEGSDSLEDLKRLEEKGSLVLTCGACIDFYGHDPPPVGEVTNMYEIVEKLMSADKIIRP